MSKFLESMRPLVLSRVKEMAFFESFSTKTTDFCQMFSSDMPHIIAEIKYKSPKGKIYNGNLPALEIAKSYVDAGASAISILSEPYYFDGDASRIKEVHQFMPKIPILMKDFILSEKQIRQARFLGASAVLLIVDFLSKHELYDLYHCCLSFNMTPLIEIHDVAGLEIALDLEPRVIGINQRDLKTMTIDHLKAKRLLPYIPKNIHVVAESGISSASEITSLQQLGCHGFLIGSYLMQHNNPGLVLSELKQGVLHEN